MAECKCVIYQIKTLERSLVSFFSYPGEFPTLSLNFRNSLK